MNTVQAAATDVLTSICQPHVKFALDGGGPCGALGKACIDDGCVKIFAGPGHPREVGVGGGA